MAGTYSDFIPDLKIGNLLRILVKFNVFTHKTPIRRVVLHNLSKAYKRNAFVNQF